MSTIIIQSHFRTYLARKKYRESRNKIILSQSLVRRFICRKSYLKLQKASIILQHYFKATLVMRQVRAQYLHNRRRIIISQAIIRGWLIRQQMKKLNMASCKIQATYRTYRIRKLYLKKRFSIITLQRYFRLHLKSKKIHQEYLILRSSTIKLQSAWRGYQIKKCYSIQKKSAILLQSYIRSFLARKKYLMIKKKVIKIQRYYIAYKVGRIEYISYHQKKNACLLIQACWRGYVIRKEMKKTINSASVIQRRYRAWLIRKRYLNMKYSCICIQQKYRSFQLMKYERQQFLCKKQATIIIQKTYRAYKCKNEYLKIRTASIKIQSWYKSLIIQHKYKQTYLAICILQKHFKAYLMGQRVRKDFHATRENIIKVQSYVKRFLAKRLFQRHICARKIQSWYRGTITRKKYLLTRKKIIIVQSLCRRYIIRNQYLKKKCAVSIIQRNWRKYNLMKKFQIELKKQHEAAKCIQRNFRSYSGRCKFIKFYKYKQQQRIKHFIDMVQLNLKAIRIQRCFRQYQLKKFAVLNVQSIVIIQRWWQIKRQRLWFLKIKNNVVIIQRAYRTYLQKKIKAVIIIQSHIRAYLVKKMLMQNEKAALKIQALWRGYLIRKSLKDKNIQGVRMRLKNAPSTTHMQLKNRTARALYMLLRERNLIKIVAALQDLDISTRYSPNCCERVVEEDGIKVIKDLIWLCNQSRPHMEIIKLSTNIFLNIAKYEKTVDAIWSLSGSLETIMKLMRTFRENNPAIFTKCCSLLWILCQDKDKAECLKNNEFISNELVSFHYLVAKKQERIAKRQNKRTSTQITLPQSFQFTLTDSRESLQIVPDWVLGRKKNREFQDQLIAITSVVDCLQLKKKKI